MFCMAASSSALLDYTFDTGACLLIHVGGNPGGKNSRRGCRACRYFLLEGGPYPFVTSSPDHLMVCPYKALWEALPKAERLRKDRMWSKWMKEQEAAGEDE